MEPKPVASSRQPRYPTRREVLAGAASLALVGLTGGKFLLAETETGQIVVAPVFAHGEGRGATGCIVVSPPVFLSEEEAMQIFREELSKYKVELKSGGVLEGVLVPGRMTVRKFETNESGENVLNESEVEVPGRTEPFKLSGTDSDRRIAIEFVSKKQYYNQGGAMDTSTVSDYDFKAVAERLASLAEKKSKDHIFLGVFYDPLADAPKDEKNDKGAKGSRKTLWDGREKEQKQESEKLLRQQAQDFVAWLKEKNAIQP